MDTDILPFHLKTAIELADRFDDPATEAIAAIVKRVDEIAERLQKRVPYEWSRGKKQFEQMKKEYQASAPLSCKRLRIALRFALVKACDLAIKEPGMNDDEIRQMNLEITFIQKQLSDEMSRK